MCKTKDSYETKRVTTEIEIFMQKVTKIKVVSLYTVKMNLKNDQSPLAY